MAKVTLKGGEELPILADEAEEGEFYYDESGNVVLGVSRLSFTPKHPGYALVVRVDTGVGAYPLTHRLLPLGRTSFTIETGE
jgi:hypothetical protein